MCLDATTKRDRETKLQCRGQVGGLVRLESSKQQEEEEHFKANPAKYDMHLKKARKRSQKLSKYMKEDPIVRERQRYIENDYWTEIDVSAWA